MENLSFEGVFMNLDINNILSWAISFIALIGVYVLTKKKKIGWIFYLIAQILSMLLYQRLQLWGLFLVNIIFAYLSIIGYIKWKGGKNNGKTAF